ncbi:MAG TPA: DsbE family thiol:disulfide interchange protein [Paracoccaceae bacterium]|nr:DsbE family thiol:disulfide interchange protein [Paracoccaceae bacterium]
MRRLLLVLPPLLFGAMAVLFWLGMGRDNPDDLPSVFIGRPEPGVPAEGLPGIPALTDADLRTGQVTVVNFWGSWCPPCRAEHPVLLEMAAQGIRVAGFNIMETPDKGAAYLAESGNPFFAVASDPRGRNRVDWGVTAPPETFILAGDGTVLFRFIGPLVGTDYQARFVPALEAALTGAGR